MPQAIHTIRPAPGGDGPFFLVSETGGSVTNVTQSVTFAQAMTQAATDGSAILTAAGATPIQTRITTDF